MNVTLIDIESNKIRMYCFFVIRIYKNKYGYLSPDIIEKKREIIITLPLMLKQGEN